MLEAAAGPEQADAGCRLRAPEDVRRLVVRELLPRGQPQDLGVLCVERGQGPTDGEFGVDPAGDLFGVVRGRRSGRRGGTVVKPGPPAVSALGVQDVIARGPIQPRQRWVGDLVAVLPGAGEDLREDVVGVVGADPPVGVRQDRPVVGGEDLFEPGPITC